MKELPFRNKVDLALLVLGLALLAAASSNALSVPFFWDDHALIEQNPVLSQIDSWQKIFDAKFWALPHRSVSNAYYRPLVIGSFALDARLWGIQPFGFHLTNLLLHFANCALLFLGVRRAGSPSYVALLAMLLFGAMPRLTESVTWISGRTDLLATLGAILAITLYRSEPAAWKMRVASALALLVGLLGKEVALAGLVALVAYEWTIAKQTQKRVSLQIQESLLNLFPLLFAVGFYFNLRAGSGVSLRPAFSLTFVEHVGAVFQALGLYVGMLLTPFQPNFYVGTLGIFVVGQIVLGVFVGAGILLALVAVFRRALLPRNATFFVLCTAALFPVLHWIRTPLRPLASDRFLYLPFWALCFLLFANYSRLSQRTQRFAALALALLAFGFLGATHKRNRDWQDEVRIWEITVGKMEKISPKNGLAHVALAQVLNTKGRPQEALGYLETAYSLEKQFQTLYPDYLISTSLLAGWGVTLSSVGKFSQATTLLADLVASSPNEAEFRYLYANALARALDFQAADREFGEALRLYPQYTDAYNVRQQARQAEQIWRSLPPETPQEATSIRAQRGLAYFLVGRFSDANPIWIEVVGAHDTNTEILEQAKTILVLEQRLFGETKESKALAEAIAKADARSGKF